MRGPGQPAQCLGVPGGGQHVGPLEALQLQPMLEQPQKLVRGGEVGGIVATDVAAGTERGQRVDGGGDVQRGIGAAVDELKKLHRELDVAQTSGAQLDLPLPHVRRNQFLDPTAHRLHLGDEILTLTGVPDHRHQGVGIGPAEFGVAHRGPGLEQGLEFPRLGPPLVVGDVRVQGADQRTRFALRTKGGVNFEERLRGEPHHLAGYPGDQWVGVLPHEYDIHIADVVQFAGTALAHRDDRQPRRRLVLAYRGGGRHECGAEGGVGEVGQVRADGLERQHGLVLDGGRGIQRREDE